MFQIDVITCHVVTKIGWMIHLVVLMHNDITELDVEIEPYVSDAGVGFIV